MLKFFYFLIIVTVIASCASMNTIKYDIDEKVIVSNNEAKYFKYLGSKSIGEEITENIPKYGDTLDATNYLWRGTMLGNYFIIKYQNNFLAINENYLTNLTKIEALKMLDSIKTTFVITQNEDKDAWARANYYVTKNSSMKIQTSNDYLLENYYRKNQDGLSFKISRLPQQDKVLYEVTSYSGIGYDEIESKKAAYFIKTGKVIKDYFKINYKGIIINE